MSHQIWHAFYYDNTSDNAAPCRTEVIEAPSEEAAVQVAQAHLGECARVSLEAAPWTDRAKRVIYAQDEAPRRTYLH